MYQHLYVGAIDIMEKVYSVQKVNEVEGILTVYSKTYKVLSNGTVIKSDGLAYRTNNNGKGYLSIHLTDGIDNRKRLYIHRIIAEMFIPNPKGLPQVNHIDGNKSNNCVENLEWTTQLENNRHAHKIGLIVEKRRKIVLQLTVTGEIIKEWPTTREAATIYNCTEEGIQQAASIYNKNCLSAKEYLWIYKNDYEQGNTDKLKKCIEKYKNGYYKGIINPSIKKEIVGKFLEMGKRRGAINKLAEEYGYQRKTIRNVLYERNRNIQQ